MTGVIIMAALLFAAPMVLLYRLAHGKPTQPTEPVRAMSKKNQQLIESYLKYDSPPMKTMAIIAYRSTPKLQHGDEGLAHYLFMREVDTVAPDYGWRQIQRTRLLEEIEARDAQS